MKKSVFVILLFITLLFVGTGCNKEKKLPEPANVGAEEPLERRGHFELRTSTLEKDDGWLYYLEEETLYEEDNSDAGEVIYFLSGVNLKYANLDAYYIPVMEEGKEIDRIDHFPELVLNKDYKEELYRIDDYLLKLKDKVGKLTEEDLSDLHTERIKKKDIVKLFNQLEHIKKYANNSDQLSKYVSLPGSDVRSVELDNGDQVQLMYFMSLKGFLKVRIEVIDAKGNYWSDEVKSGKAEKAKQEIMHLFEKVSDKIVQEQNLDAAEQIIKKGKDSPYTEALWRLLIQLDADADK